MARRPAPGASFSLRFFSWLLLFSLLFWLLSVHQHLGLVQRGIAAVTALAERGVGGRAFANGDDIVTANLIMNVSYECTGIFVYVLFASFVLAYPASWTERLTGLTLAIPLFLAINVLRLAILARIVEIYPGAFFYLHEYVWQGIFTVFVLLGAMAWAERST